MLFKLLLKGDLSGIETWATDLSNAGAEIRRISAAKAGVQQLSSSSISWAGQNGETFNSGLIGAYRAEIQGLTADQAALVLSNGNLSEAQTKLILTYNEGKMAATAMSQAEAAEIMNRMGYTTVTQMMTEAELLDISAKTGVDAATIKNALVETGLVAVKDGDIIATEELTEAELKEALVSEGSALANKEETASIIAETVAKKAENKVIKSNISATNMLAATWNKFTGVIKAHPILSSLAIFAALLAAAKKLDDAIKKNHKNLRELGDTTASTYKDDSKTFDETLEKYKELTDKIREQDLSASELASTKSQLKDLQDQLIDTYGNEAKKIDLVNGGYEQQLRYLKSIQKEKARTTLYGDKGLLVTDSKTKLTPAQEAQQYINGSAPEFEDVTGLSTKDFNLEKILSKYSAIDYSTYETTDPISGQKESHSRFTKKAKATQEEFYNQLTAVIEEIESQYGDNEQAKQFVEKVKHLREHTDYSPEEYGKQVEVLNQTIDAIMQLDNPELLEKTQNAIDEYNKAFDEYQLDPDEANKEVLETKRAALEATKLEVEKYFGQNEKLKGLDEPYHNYFNDVYKQQRKTSGEQVQEYFSELPSMGISDQEKGQWAGIVRRIQNDEKLSTAFLKLDLPENVQEMTLKDLKYFFEQAQLLADENPIEVKTEVDPSASDAVDSMNELKSAVSSIGDLWQQTVANKAKLGRDKKYTDAEGNITKQTDDNGLAIGYADPALITSVRSAFDKFSDDLKNKGDKQGADTINQALKTFENTLVEFPGDAEKAQDAIDNLITAYIDQTDVIKNLTEKNAEWSEAQLEAMGITNAHDVVMARLNKDTKNLYKNIGSLASALDTLAEAEEKGTDNTEALDSINTALGKMLSFDLSDGSQFVPEFDSQWITNNLDLIKQAASEDVEAIAQLQKEASKQVVAHVDIQTNAPNEEEIYGIRDHINSLIDSYDINDVEVGTSLDSTPMIQGLNALVEAGKMTRESMNQILSGIGVKPVVRGYETVKVTTKNLDAALNERGITNDTARANARSSMMSQSTISIPIIGYEVASKPVGAKYANNTTPSTGGGNNGGGNNGSDSSSDNGLNKDTAETFDWIEVAIQRIEEAINRLDKTLGNVYKKWGERNVALEKELGKVADKIKAEQKASSEYIRNANDVTGSGTIMDDDDKAQLKKAKKTWKKSKKNKLGKKAKEGKLKQSDVDKIKNEYLQDAAAEQLYYSEQIKDLKKQKKEATKSKNTKEANKLQKKINKLQKNIKKVKVTEIDKPRKSDYSDTRQYKYDLNQYKAALKIWKTGEYQAKVRNGQLTDDDIEQISNKFLVEAINNYKEFYQKSIDAADAVQELEQQMSELNKQRFDNLKTQFDEVIELMDKYAETYDVIKERAEEYGYWLTESFYNKEIEDEKAKQTELIAERQALIDKLNESIDNGSIQAYSEAWYEMFGDIQSVNDEINTSVTNVIKLNREIQQLHWDQFDALQEKLDDINSEAEFLRKGLALNDMLEENGFYNDRGWANAALISAEYDNNVSKLRDYQAELAKLQKEQAEDPGSKIIDERIQTVTEGLRSVTEAIWENEEAMKSFVEESINKHLENLQKIIDKYKESLTAAKD